MKKRFLLSALTCGLLLGVTTLQAKTPTKTLMETQIKKHTQEQKRAPKEVIEGIQATFKAVHLIETDKLAEAEKLLQKASDNFTEALKKDPRLDLIPLEESLIAYSFTGSSQVIEDTLKLTSKLIEEHDTQAAIALISPLKDELDINVVSIPMTLYPQSTKKALEALKKKDKQGALAALAVGFGTLVNTQIIMPTPLLTAQDLIIEASNLDKSKKEDAKKLLDVAKEELKRAALLGYTKKHDQEYKLLNDDIEKIEKEIKGKNVVEKLYDTVKKDLKRIIENIRVTKIKVPNLSHNKAAQKVEQYEVKEQNKAISETKTFKQEALQDANKTIK